MTPSLTLVVVAKNHEEAGEFLERNDVSAVDEFILLDNPRARFGGTGTIGNHALEHGRCDVVGLVHADTLFAPGAFEAFVAEAMLGTVAGMVGRSQAGAYVWSRDVQESTQVSTLDACACFLKRTIPVRFDTQQFDSFHCCVEDLCLSATDAGIPVRVPRALGCDHLGTNWQKPSWMDSYKRYRDRLQVKWGHLEFQTT